MSMIPEAAVERVAESLVGILKRLSAMEATLDRIELRTPSEWEKIDRLRVVNPDGWSHGSYRSWDEPISREEWNRRVATSTVDLSQRY